MNQSDFQLLTRERIAEAEVLLNATPPRPNGAYYLAGYAVECALKAVICSRFQALTWPDKQLVKDCFTHSIKSLIVLAKLETDRKNEAAVNKEFEDNWVTVCAWSEESRYSTHPMVDAVRLIDAVNDPTNGVLPWIISRW